MIQPVCAEPGCPLARQDTYAPLLMTTVWAPAIGAERPKAAASGAATMMPLNKLPPGVFVGVGVAVTVGVDV